jgi:hypothetical protein
MMKPTNDLGPEFWGRVLGKLAAAFFVAYLVTSFNLPLWAVALLVFCV